MFCISGQCSCLDLWKCNEFQLREENMHITLNNTNIFLTESLKNMSFILSF